MHKVGGNIYFLKKIGVRLGTKRGKDKLIIAGYSTLERD